MKQKIPPKLKELAAKLGEPLYIVGGFCRDEIAGLCGESCDIDICSPAPAKALCAAAEQVGFEITATYAHTGTVRLVAEGREYEYASFRTDKYVRGEHSPSEVFFTRDINADARRRDFKCNAVYYDIGADSLADPLGGIEDAKRGILSTVAPPDKVFGEDGLRLMRLCRIAAQTGFSPSDDCLEGARERADLICDIAPERIWAELKLILCADGKYGKKGGHYRGLKLLSQTGVLKYILPELAAGENMAQRSDYHDHDVLEHSLRCALYAPPGIRLAALLHDVGKPYCMRTTGRYALHEEEGERIARDICSRLRISSRESARVCALVKWHMYDYSLQARESKVRKFIVAHPDILDDLLLLKQADYSACKDRTDKAPCVGKWEKIRENMIKEGVPMSLKELAVRGDELIAAGLNKADTSSALNFLLGECAADARLNKKQTLVNLALSRFGAR